jgi:hypothetical protein
MLKTTANFQTKDKEKFGFVNVKRDSSSIRLILLQKIRRCKGELDEDQKNRHGVDEGGPS